ncbi:MAG: porin family protein [Methylobacterium mesophilicum]|nr:porin family protein [Methylobacterium mesophilicum]
MPLKTSLLLLLSSAVLLPVTLAQAADYDPPVFEVAQDAPEYKPVEVGSGWYLRGDLGYQLNEAFETGNRQFTSDFSATPIRASEDENMFSGSLGIGYHFTDWLRSDVNVGYIAGNDVSASYDDGVIGARGSLSNDAWYGMANLYADLGTIAGFTPYVGAGAGIYASKIEGETGFTNADDPTQNASASIDERKYSAAYSLNAGIAYNFGNNLSADLGYQFLAAPQAEYLRLDNVNAISVQEGVQLHQVRLGLRYDLW